MKINGSCVNYDGGAFACAVIDQHFRRFLIGQDSFNIELIWDQMNRSTLPYGPRGITNMAIAGVNLALWDLMGHALKQPVYRLLGGQTKESILLVCHDPSGLLPALEGPQVFRRENRRAMGRCGRPRWLEKDGETYRQAARRSRR